MLSERGRYYSIIYIYYTYSHSPSLVILEQLVELLGVYTPGDKRDLTQCLNRVYCSTVVLRHRAGHATAFRFATNGNATTVHAKNWLQTAVKKQ